MKESSLPSRQTGRSEADDLVSRLFPEMAEPDANTSDVYIKGGGHCLTLVHPDEDIEASLLAPEHPAKGQRSHDSTDVERYGNESPLACEPLEPQNESFESLYGLCGGHTSGSDISVQQTIDDDPEPPSIERSIPTFDIATGEQDSFEGIEADTEADSDSWELPSPEAQPAVQGVSSVPPRIGNGKLVSTRLTWKPGDPFGGASRPRKGAFKWEIMLTTACITAACGMGCIWLLRTVLA